MWIESVEQQYYKACTGVICKKPYEFFFNSRTIYRKSILIGAIEEWIINKSIDSRAIQQYRYLSWYYVRLLNKFQSFIFIRRPPFWIPRFFDTFLLFCIFGRVFCSILFGMKGGESNLLIHVLHYLILCTSATRGWVSQIHCPSYRIKPSKIDNVNLTVFFV